MLDTTQAENISRAIDEYEKKYIPQETFTDPKVILFLHDSSERIYSKYPKRKKRAQKLSKNKDILDSIEPAVWGKDLND